MTYRITIKEDGEAIFHGVDMGGTTQLAALSSKYIAIRVSGHTGWSGRGQTKYYGAYISVYEITKRDANTFWADYILDIPIRAKDDDFVLKAQIAKLFEGK